MGDDIKGVRTRKELEKILKKKYPNIDFEKALKENSKEVIEMLGVKGIPEETDIKVVDDASVLYLVMPKKQEESISLMCANLQVACKSLICPANCPNVCPPKCRTYFM